jgi:hypothetical protein
VSQLELARERKGARVRGQIGGNRFSAAAPPAKPRACRWDRPFLPPFEKIEVGEGRFVGSRGITGVFIRQIARFSPLRLVYLNPMSEEAMADMWRIAWFDLVARVDHNEPPGIGEERAHVSAKHLVLDQVVDDVEGEHKIKATEVRRQLAGQIKAFRGVGDEALTARRYRRLRHVDADIAGVSREGELRAVATAKFDDRLDAHSRNEAVQGFRLEFCEAPERAGTRGSTLPVALLPIR